MDEYTAKDRMSEGQNYLKKYKIEMQVFAGLVFIFFMIALGPSLLSDPEGYGTNVYTEFASVLATIFVIDRLNERREQQIKKDDLLDDLVRRVGSPSNEVALDALDELRKRKFPLEKGGILAGKNLEGANLAGADLRHIDFTNTNLITADLTGIKGQFAVFTGAKLIGAKFTNAELYKTDFAHAQLLAADMSNAEILSSNFEHSKLPHSKFINAKVEHTNFIDADLRYVVFKECFLWCNNMTSAKLENADFSSADIFGVNFSKANLSQAMFNVRTRFDRAEVNREQFSTILPDGVEISQLSPELHLRLTLDFGMEMLGTDPEL